MEIGLAIVGAVASAALPEVASAFKAKFKKPLPCQSDVDKLGVELRLMISSIKDYEESSYGKKCSHLQESLVKELRTLAHDIEDCTESFMHQVMSDDGLEKTDTSEEFGEKILKLLASAQQWNTRFTEATKNHVGGSSSGAGAPDIPAEKIFCDPPKGMEEPLKKLQKLVAEDNSESKKKLKVISIVGFGGLGKTLLARHVYIQMKEKFDLSVWIRADGKEAKQLLEEILEEVLQQGVGDNVDDPPAEDVKAPTTSIFDYWLRRTNDEHVAVRQEKDKGKVTQDVTSYDVTISDTDRLAQRLKSILHNKRYLIVLIDMWRKEQWSGVERAFTGSSYTGSRIIVTSTKLPVAKACSDGGGYVHKMRSLTGDYPHQILSHRESSAKIMTRCDGLLRNLKLDEKNPPPLDELSAKILKKCDGLPLALICLAESCKGELEIMETRSEQAFVKMCGPPSADTPTGNSACERMRRMLLSSYQDLPSSFVKVCLLYYCMFPADDHTVRRNSVIRRLLAEGLAETGDGRAVDNLETLVDHCVIQSTEVSNNGKTKRCKVPGIVLEFITRMSQDQGFVTVCDGSQTAQPPANARRLSLHPNSQWKLPTTDDKRKAGWIPKVRTLAVFSDKDKATTLSNKEAIATYQLMRVLDLEGCGGLDDSDLKSISCNLLLLKYLSLGSSITEVPTEIRKLQLLETLDLRKTSISEVPVEVIKLPQLKNLLGKFQLAEGHVFRKRDTFLLKENKIVKKNLVEFLSSADNKLEMLSGFVIGSSQGFPQLLIHMANLRKVKIWCDSTTSEKNLKDLSEGIRKFLCLTLKDNDRSLSIHIKDCLPSKKKDINDFFQDYPLTETPQVNQGGHRPSLYSFKFCGKLSRFPEFLTHLRSITELCLSGTNLSTEHMQAVLNRLPKSTLKYLKLVEKKLGPLMLSKENFTSLVRICLVAEEETDEITVSDGALPALVSLHVICKSLDGLSGINIRRFPALKEVGLHHNLDNTQKGLWEAAAKNLPNWPDIVLIDPPKPKGY